MSAMHQALLMAGAAGDANFANVVSLLHGDGTNGTQVFTDQKGKVWTPRANNLTWTFSGNAQLDTAQFLYGTSSLLLDGTGDYISTNDTVDVEPGAGDFTIECAVRLNGTADDQWVFSKYTASGNQRSYALRINATTGRLDFLYSTTGSNLTSFGSTFTWATGTWYRLAVSRVGATWYMFVDGTQIASAAAATPFNSNAAFQIGAANAGATNLVNGWVDEFRFTKGVGRYNAGYTPDASAFGNTVGTDASYASVTSLLHFDGADAATSTLDGAKTPGLDTAQKLYGTASILPGGAGWLETPDSADFEFGSGDFAIEAAVRFTAFSAAQYIFTKYTATLNQREYAFLVDGTGANLRFQYSLNGISVAEDIGGAFTFSTNTWYRVAVTRSGTTIRLFVDGSVVATSSTISTNSIQAGTSPARIGGAEFGSPVQGFIVGNVDEVRVTKGVARYTAGYTPATAAFPDF